MFEKLFGNKGGNEQSNQEQPWTQEAPETSPEVAEELELNKGRSPEEIDQVLEEEGYEAPQKDDEDTPMVA